jgi:hypothetical protein
MPACSMSLRVIGAYIVRIVALCLIQYLADSRHSLIVVSLLMIV